MGNSGSSTTCKSADERQKFFIEILEKSKKKAFSKDFFNQYYSKHTEDGFEIPDLEEHLDYLVKTLKKEMREGVTDCKNIIDLLRYDYNELFGRPIGHLELGMFILRKNDEENIFLSRDDCFPVVNTLKTGNHRFMEILANYGWSGNIMDCRCTRVVAAVNMEQFLLDFKGRLMSDEESIRRHLRSAAFMGVVCFYLKNDPESPLFGSLSEFFSRAPQFTTLPSVNSFLVLNELLQFQRDRLFQFSKISFARVFLFILAVKALAMKFSNESEFIDYVKTLDIYFKTVRKPYLTATEVRNVFSGCIICKDQEYMIEQMYTDFLEIPFCARSYEPRTLSHLARCQVRQNLCKKESALPAVIEKMDLPKRIKEYILCNL